MAGNRVVVVGQQHHGMCFFDFYGRWTLQFTYDILQHMSMTIGQRTYFYWTLRKSSRGNTEAYNIMRMTARCKIDTDTQLLFDFCATEFLENYDFLRVYRHHSVVLHLEKLFEI